jgi:aspartyl protease family protein
MARESKPEFSQRLGKGMIIVAWLVVLGLLTLFFNHWQDRQYNPNQQYESRVTSAGVREITLLRNRYGHYVANGQINGRDVVFMLDTGATTVSVPETVARRLELEGGAPYRVSTANGTITVYATRLDRLELGDIILNNVRADINPYMDSDDILLGMNVLKNLELIQRGERLTLRQHATY